MYATKITKSATKKEYILLPQKELRLEVTWNTQISITLSDGKAEIFGTELAANVPYEFYGGSKVAVFTYHGAVVKIEGDPGVAYIGDGMMNEVLNCHLS